MTLKKRIIPLMLVKGQRLVKTCQFKDDRDVGDPVKSAAVYSSQFADELIILNIERSEDSLLELSKLLHDISEVCFMPLAIGGGIRSYEDAARLISQGADKVVLNSVCYQRPEIITKIADNFGSQAVTVAIDCLSEPQGGWSCWSDGASQKESFPLEQHIESLTAAGAGEILIQSINRDGVMSGMDTALIKSVCELTNLPIIGCGGAGDYYDLKEAFLDTGVDALAMGSLFNFTDSNPIRAKAFLTNYNLDFKKV